jgi:formate dehydrogenase maturation protein FdhE
MIIPPIEQNCPEQSEWQQYCEQLREASSLSAIVWNALQMGLLLARLMVEQELTRRAEEPTAWGTCPTCGSRLHSKGWQSRQMQTLVGKID